MEVFKSSSCYSTRPLSATLPPCLSLLRSHYSSNTQETPHPELEQSPRIPHPKIHLSKLEDRKQESLVTVFYILEFGGTWQVTECTGASIKGKWKSEVTQWCPTLCDPMDCSLPGYSIHGTFQARVLEWIAISFSRGFSWPRNRTRVSCIAGRRFTLWATREAHSSNYKLLPIIFISKAFRIKNRMIQT